MLIDTHAHLNYPEIQNILPELLSRAHDSGVDKIIVPATSYASSLEVVELVQKHKMLYAAVGIHPNDLKDFNENQLSEIENLTDNNKIVAIGEIGLDYYREPYDKVLQAFVLRSQLQIAKRKNLPVILHNRNSSEDLMKIVEEEYENGRLKGQFHSFSGDNIMSKRCIEMGFCISFTGNITYKPKEHTYISYQIVKEMPLEHLLLETDTPYMAPVPHRGKQNEPSFIKHTAQKLAEIKDITFEEISLTAAENAERLFKI